jgi:hypothetical protein
MVKKVKSAACALAVVTICGLGGSAVPALAQPLAGTSAPGWHLTKVVGTGQQNVDPNWPGGLAAPSGANAWLTWGGCVSPCNAGPSQTLAHWNGHRWSAVPASDMHGLEPVNVVASSAKDAWVLGPVPNSNFYGARHWNGSRWGKVSTPTWMMRANGSGEYDVYTADFGPRNLWVFSLGSYIGEKTAFAARYHNGRWTKSFLPDVPEQAAALSSTDIWVLGLPFSGKGTEVVLRWNGHRWTKSGLPRQREAGYPYGLVATGPKSLWVIWQPAKAGERQYLLHWTGHRWAKVSLPANDEELALAGDGGSGLWATAVGPGKAQPQLFMHWSGGHWKVTRVPFQFAGQIGQANELAAIGGTRSVWGVGHVYTAGPSGLNRVAIWRYNP